MSRELSQAATGIVTLILTPTGSGDDPKPDVPSSRSANYSTHRNFSSSKLEFIEPS